MRTNHLLDGYCMPFIFAHQFADEFHHAAAEGMVATDYDSLTGHWSTQGPNLYVALRLHAKPEASADALLAEYYAGFGAAAGKVKQYFDDWEAYTAQLGSALPRVMKDTGSSRWRTWARAAHVLYPDNCFDRPEALLREAALAANGDTETAARVAFLHEGLEHARLCSRAAAKLSLAAPESGTEEGRAALEELVRFRRSSESSGISNFNHLAWVEDLSWRLSEETKKAPELYP
jgi:hypothetical protein